MSNIELINIYGGASFSATMLNSFIKMFTSMYDMGRRLSTSIMRSRTGNSCSL